MASFFYVVSYCHLSATIQTISITVETYRQSSCGSNFYRTFKVFHVTVPRKWAKETTFFTKLWH